MFTRKISLLIVSILLALFAIFAEISGTSNAWFTKQTADAACTSNNEVVITVSLTNNEDWREMDVTATDLQSGISVDLGTIAAGETVYAQINTGLSNVSDGTVKFDLTWPYDSRKDVRTADYNATNCAPPPTTGEPLSCADFGLETLASEDWNIHVISGMHPVVFNYQRPENADYLVVNTGWEWTGNPDQQQVTEMHSVVSPVGSSTSPDFGNEELAGLVFWFAQLNGAFTGNEATITVMYAGNGSDPGSHRSHGKVEWCGETPPPAEGEIAVEVTCEGMNISGETDVPTTIDWTFGNESGSEDVNAGEFEFTVGSAYTTYGPHTISGTAEMTVDGTLYSDDDEQTLTCGPGQAEISVEVTCEGMNISGETDVPTTIDWTFGNESGSEDVNAGEFEFTVGSAYTTYGPHTISGTAEMTVDGTLYSDDDEQTLTCGPGQAEISVEVTCEGMNISGETDVPTTIDWTFGNESGSEDVNAGEFEFTVGSAYTTYGPHTISGTAEMTVDGTLYSDDDEQTLTCGPQEQPNSCENGSLVVLQRGSGWALVEATVNAEDNVRSEGAKFVWGDNTPDTVLYGSGPYAAEHTYNAGSNKTFHATFYVLINGVWVTQPACADSVSVQVEGCPDSAVSLWFYQDDNGNGIWDFSNTHPYYGGGSSFMPDGEQGADQVYGMLPYGSGYFDGRAQINGHVLTNKFSSAMSFEQPMGGYNTVGDVMPFVDAAGNVLNVTGISQLFTDGSQTQVPAQFPIYRSGTCDALVIFVGFEPGKDGERPPADDEPCEDCPPAYCEVAELVATEERAVSISGYLTWDNVYLYRVIGNFQFDGSRQAANNYWVSDGLTEKPAFEEDVRVFVSEGQCSTCLIEWGVEVLDGGANIFFGVGSTVAGTAEALVAAGMDAGQANELAHAAQAAWAASGMHSGFFNSTTGTFTLSAQPL